MPSHLHTAILPGAAGCRLLSGRVAGRYPPSTHWTGSQIHVYRPPSPGKNRQFHQHGAGTPGTQYEAVIMIMICVS